ncbi:hypothetical protein [Psychromonas ossibalaenae]|uniref:hypothetical protein n=1 Tax=Psychromonas ossibalaenae TaxID=444922 RepID=UPI00035E9519|nr:hypothetical protein [Psychromonas ossibalaenae]
MTVNPSDKITNEAVILLHGLAKSDFCMKKIAASLTRQARQDHYKLNFSSN